MTAFTYRGAQLHAEDVSLSQLAEKYGTPCYIYSAAQIRANYRAYTTALTRALGKGRFNVCYACKANGNQAVLSLLQREGAGPISFLPAKCSVHWRRAFRPTRSSFQV